MQEYTGPHMKEIGLLILQPLALLQYRLRLPSYLA